jgi:serine phosphatase RsbU (regulator of sigma subunit)
VTTGDGAAVASVVHDRSMQLRLALGRLEAEKAVIAALHEVSAVLNRERDTRRREQVTIDAATRLGGAASGVLIARDSDLQPWRVAARTGTDDADLTTTALRIVVGEATPPTTGHRPSIPGERSVDGVAVLEDGQLLAAPMTTTSGEVMAVLFVGQPRAGVFDTHHTQLIAGVAAHAAIAMENARLHDAARREIAARQAALDERDRVARLLQQSLLPPHLPEIEGLDLAAGFVAMTDGIGGDFYDVFPLQEDEWGIVLGDVCGKGPSAAAVTALARYTVRTAAMTCRRPHEALHTLNDALVAHAESEPGSFCTAVFARLRPHPAGVRLTVAVAGHPPVLVLRAGGSLEAYDATGPLLGVFDRVDLEDVQIDLGPGDACIFYTDGATDVRREGETFGDDRLRDVVSGCRGMTAPGIAGSVERAVVDFQRYQVDDDLALVVVAVPVTAGAGRSGTD